ncbi:phosphatidylinositol-specific phospholipase C [Diaporthe amygdali]|uniref:phosphatidylinositol-specific phospholipase C n=1 Tax=Phomopsis amygdali TaxID=1214568 RepID=UPI0022FEC5F3|nr:phosphatidylinositol-specific phospholipase C [Diaporthe amygdali]KAJ0104198.1 phosphatidylinositol-specific phospholipase C [Diaporthe amygdali]
MGIMPPPSGVATPACTEGKRHHRGRSYGRHLSRPDAADRRSTSSRGSSRSNTSAPGATKPPSLEPSIRRALSRLYDHLKGTEKTLSAADLEFFLREMQNDRDKPYLKNVRSGTTYSFPEFCDFWYEHASHSKGPIEKLDLDKPMSNYYINSSHNTYIGDGDQVIKRGCRCVEIDVWNSPHLNETPRSPRALRQQRGPIGQHWSLDSLLSWMKMRFQNGAGADRRQSFKKPLVRVRALSDADWDEKLEHEPRVCHCLPTPIAGDLSARTGLPFRLVCRAIKAVAFEQTDLPLIISLENHTTGSQQEEMVKIMKDEWQGLLLEDSLPGCDPETQQPNVRDLRGKILIKGRKKAQKNVTAKSNLKCEVKSIRSEAYSSISSKFSTTKAHEYYHTTSQTTSPPKKQKVKGEKILDALDKLAIYTFSPGPFKSFNSRDADKPAHIFSFGEEKLKALHRTKHKDIFQHNKKYLARTFPESLSAFLSTNPNLPTLFWRKGVQMVALNWQYWDTAMHLNDAMFEDSNGWVLKPREYQSDSAATCQAQVKEKKKISLCITILGGQHIPTPRVLDAEESNEKASTDDSDVRAIPVVDDNDFRPKVKCYLHVESHRERNPMKKMSEEEICKETKSAETRNPTWPEHESKLEFPTVSHVVEKLSFVRFRVEHCGLIRDQRTAWACIRLDRLQEGYRLINLKDPGGGSTDGMLLVNVQKTIHHEPPRPLSFRAKTWNALGCDWKISASSGTIPRISEFSRRETVDVSTDRA